MMILCILMLKVPSMPLFGVCRWRSGCSLLFQIDITIRRARDSGVRSSMFSIPIDKIAALFNEMHIIDLVNAPDFIGIGQPGDGPGILSGALPTAETVIEGVERITPELMALGFATGKAIMPDHSGMLFIFMSASRTFI